MELGVDVLIEKPISSTPNEARMLIETAERTGRILQVGHLERLNPAVVALGAVITKPLFFEVHRLSEFSPRSLDVDVVLDLMIHDIDIVLTPFSSKRRRKSAPRAFIFCRRRWILRTSECSFQTDVWRISLPAESQRNAFANFAYFSRTSIFRSIIRGRMQPASQ